MKLYGKMTEAYAEIEEEVAYLN